MSDGTGAAATAAPKKILLYFATEEIANLLTFVLESRYFSEAHSFFGSRDAVPALQSTNFDLALIDTSLPEAMLVFEQVRTAKLPFVLYHPDGTSPEVRGPKIKAHREKELLPAVEDAILNLGAAALESGGGTGVPFAKISPALLARMRLLPTDIFVRLSDLKFVKLFHQAAPFGERERAEYHDKRRIPYLYVRRDALPAVAEAVTRSLERLLQQTKPPRAEVAAVTVDAIETIHELARHIGFTPEVQKLVKANMDLTVKEMQAVPSLASVLAGFERNKEKYIAAHSQMLAELSCAIAIAMEWGSEMSLKKITMASLLHDMVMTDHRLCAVKDLGELDARKQEFTLEQQEEYKTHPKRAALLIQGMKEVPADVDKIVYQHHELPRGTGFPEAVGHTHIHPLAATLMVAHDLVDWIIEHPGAVDVADFAEAFRDKYQPGTFKKILKALETLKM